MNIFAGSGRLVNNAVVNGTENRAMKFTIAAGCGYKDRTEKEKVEFVPCVIFNLDEDIESFLVEQGKGVFVEVQGRVSTSRFEANGEVKYSTQVVVGKGKLNIVRD